MTVKRQWIAPDDPDISIAQQCALVGMARSSHYYQLGIESEENLELMRLLDEQHLQTPFYGRRRMTAFLRQKGYTVNGKRVLRLLRLMGLAAVGPKPNLSKRAEGAQIYPYLLREFKPAAANEVWCSDITYVLVQRYNVCSDAARIYVSGCRYGLAQSFCSELGVVQQSGNLLLPRSPGRGDRLLRQAGHLQY